MDHCNAIIGLKPGVRSLETKAWWKQDAFAGDMCRTMAKKAQANEPVLRRGPWSRGHHMKTSMNSLRLARCLDKCSRPWPQPTDTWRLETKYLGFIHSNGGEYQIIHEPHATSSTWELELPSSAMVHYVDDSYK